MPLSERDEKQYTERDLILAKREGFAIATARASAHNYDPDRCRGVCAEARDAAEKAYPLPMVTRPRVVRDPHNHEPHWGKPREWMCKDGQFYSRTVGMRAYPYSHLPFAWTIGAQIPPTPERVELWAALLATPTETVPDDGWEETSNG